jgi:hypothetical protein
MKKNILSIFLVVLFYIAKAQVSFIVLQPAAIQGGYNFTYNSPPTWGVPDLLVPANAVTGSVVMAYDASSADSLGCEELVTDVTGKIALVYRGTCFHDEKAFNAQQAGAIGIILINNAPGQMPQVSGLTPGLITIPVTMISDEAGAAMRAQLEAEEEVVVFIGNSAGYFNDDLGLSTKNMLIPSSSLLPAALAQNAGEFSVEMGAWVYNYGAADQTPALSAKVILNGTILYNEASTSFSLLSGDSTYVTLPIFTQPSYAEGYYNFVYEVNGVPDELNYNNSISHKLLISNDQFGLLKVDSTGKPETTGAFQAANSSESTIFQSCIVFKDEHASRLGAKGLSFYALTTFGTSIVGKFIEINAYEWNDEFTGINDPNFDFSNITEIGFGVYDYEENLQGIMVSADFEAPFLMEDNQKYLFCMTSYGAEKFIGFDSNIHYEWNIKETDQPVMAISVDGQFSLGFINPSYPSIILNTLPASALGVVENKKIEVTPFPNPANNNLSIPLKGILGKAVLVITDASGKIISNQNLNVNNNQTINVNTFGLQSGLYHFNLAFDNGKSSFFKVVINK